jgi:hypothetical protein
MSGAVRESSKTVKKAVIAAHLLIAPFVTWLAIIYSTLGAPWRAVTALWLAQAALLGEWCALSSAPLKRRLGVSFVGLVWLSAMPTARQIVLHGIPPRRLGWLALTRVYGHYPLYFGIHFAAAVSAVAWARYVWPRWQLVATGGGSQLAPVPQYSIGQLMLGVLACTPLLLAARLTHDYIRLEAGDLPTWLLGSLIYSSLTAAIAALSVWAALGRTHLMTRLVIALLAAPIAVTLVCFATQAAPSEVAAQIGFEEMKLAVVLVTLLFYRCSGCRIAAAPPARSPFMNGSGAASD